MGVNKGHLCSVANGHRPWTPYLRGKVLAVLGEVPGQGVVYRKGGPVTGESSFIRERAREQGMTLKDLAVAVGVSYRYMTQAARGQRDMSPRVQARVESALGGPVEIAAAECANRRHGPVKGETTWIRERARELGMSMRELAEKAGVSLSYLSQVARGLRNMGPAVQAGWRRCWKVRPGSNRPSGLSLTLAPFGTGWMRTGSARTRRRGGRASASRSCRRS